MGRGAGLAGAGRRPIRGGAPRGARAGAGKQRGAAGRGGYWPRAGRRVVLRVSSRQLRLVFSKQNNLADSGARSSWMFQVTRPALRDPRVHCIRESVSTRTVAGLRLGGESRRAAGNCPVQGLRREAARGETTCLFLERLFGQPEELFGGCGRRARGFFAFFFFLVSRLDVEMICLV